jgi:HSP20 family molecular chaperone IbpA
VRGVDELIRYQGWWKPRADIMEEGDDYIVEFELPGVPKDAISLSVSQYHLVLTSVKPQTLRERKGSYYQVM